MSSYAEIQAQIAELQEKAREIRKQEQAEAIAEIRAVRRSIESLLKTFRHSVDNLD